MTSAQTRRYGLIAALLLTLAATWWAAQSQDDAAADIAQPSAGQRRAPVAAAKPAPALAQAQAQAQTADWSPVARGPWAAAKDAQFAAWAPPPPPPPPKPEKLAKGPPQPPPPPVAPAFPYQLMGRLVEGTQAQGFLVNGSRSLAVKAGDVVDGQWRVDQITDTGLKLTWLPAQLTQTIALRPAS